jgi:tripartite ATP-independent transporter DctM subunit
MEISVLAMGIGLLLLVGLMAIGLHVATVMFLLAAIAATLYLGPEALLSYGTQYWSATNNYVLVAIPLFVLLGEILVRGGFTDRMYQSLADWLNPLPGGLLHTNIGASAIFAAVSGSSVATAATIGTVAIPAFRGRGYDPKLVLGTVAAGATLGILIPPSINMIIYGAMTNTSVGRLYAAGVFPGLLLTALFSLVVVLMCWYKPSYAGAKEPLSPLAHRLRRLIDLIPPLIIFIIVMGSIYAGWATPTEAAGIGVIVAIALAGLYRTVSFKMLHECFVVTTQVSAMIMLIAVTAFYLNFVLGIMGVAQALAEFVSSLGTSQLQLILVLLIMYLILGCFMDALAMIIGTIPIVMPLVTALKIDPVWFGIFLVIMAEMALITPPVGMNLYVVQGIRKEGSISEVIIGVLPFLLMMFVLVFLLVVWPDLALWLPRVTFG